MIDVVATGTWLHDETFPSLSGWFRTDYDFWFDVGEANGDRQEDDPPRLSGDGCCYYVCYKPGWEPGQPFWPDSIGFMSIPDAKVAAETKVPGVVVWA